MARSAFALALAAGLLLFACCIDIEMPADLDLDLMDSSPSVVLVIGEKGSDLGEFNTPVGVAVDSEDNIIVADSWNHRIQVFDKNGGYMYRIGSEGTEPGKFRYPEGVAVDGYGRIIVVDDGSYGGRIQFFKVNGEIRFIGAFDEYATGPGESRKFSNAFGITVDKYERMLVTERDGNKVVILSKEGQNIGGLTTDGTFGIGGSGPRNFHSPGGIASDSKGRIIVVDTYNYRVQVFSDRGEFIEEFGEYGSGPGQFVNPYGVAVDSRDNIIVSDTCRVQVFDKDCEFIEEIGKCGSGSGEFGNLWGIAVDSQDRIIVADSDNGRVQVLRR